MICGVFGLPRAGKTTFLTYLALEALKGKSLSVGHFRYQKPIGEFAPYKRVFCNFPLEGCYMLDFDALGVFDFSNSLILIDEIMLLCDSRDWKNFRADLRDFLALHGHYRCDIVYCSQGYRDTDLRIRNLTERLFYIEKFRQFTRVRPIDKGFKFDEQINEGYTLGSPLSATYILRKRYYRYFNSFDAPELPENPASVWDIHSEPKATFCESLKLWLKKWFSPAAPERSAADVASEILDQCEMPVSAAEDLSEELTDELTDELSEDPIDVQNARSLAEILQ